MVPIDSNYKAALLEMYSVDEEKNIEMSKKALGELWARYKGNKTFVRNEALPAYNTAKKVVKASGTYTTDEEALLETWKFVRQAVVKENMRKHQQAWKAAAKKVNGDDYIEKTAMAKWNDANKVNYDTKLRRWQQHGYPKGLAAFIFIGKPGIDAICFQVGGSDAPAGNVSVKSKKSRLGMQQDLQDARVASGLIDHDGNATGKTSTGKGLGLPPNPLVSIKQSEMKLTEQALQREKQLWAFQLLREENQQDSDQYQQLRAHLLAEAMNSLKPAARVSTPPIPQARWTPTTEDFEVADAFEPSNVSEIADASEVVQRADDNFADEVESESDLDILEPLLVSAIHPKEVPLVVTGYRKRKGQWQEGTVVNLTAEGKSRSGRVVNKPGPRDMSAYASSSSSSQFVI
jgi:hypothetical protein